jgi:cytochrome c-type biogenesis protein CcmF
MIPELGHFALILALTLALVMATLPLIGAQRGIVAWMRLARSLAHGQFVFVAMAFACLAYSFLNSDFSVLNVASNSNSLLPAHYRFAATWGSHEGSLLLWVLMLSIWMVAVANFSRRLPPEMLARVLAVMGFISVGFLLFLLLTSNPFARLLPAAQEGSDLNPLLQDPGMVVHPPMLYMGYVGFSVAFAFSIAALLGGRLDATWARWSRPWTIAAWCFLTVGILLGSWWSYNELGWGGWWFWDPVENASFMPWLVGTALLHSLAVTEKRGAFKRWTVLLAIAAFSLSLIGTFLVRSGVLTSVHAFATDPARGLFILVFLTVVIGGALSLYAFRAPSVTGGGHFDLISRESLLLTNNVLLVVACATVLLGTLYPLFLDALSGGTKKISVGPPYFETVFVPIMAPTVFLMGIGPIARWKKTTLPEIWILVRWAFVISLVLAICSLAVSSHRSWLASMGLFLAFWIVLTTVVSVRERIHHFRGALLERLFAQPRSWWGMTIAHLGVAVFVVGVTVVRTYEVQRDVRMAVGDSIAIDPYNFRFDGTESVNGPNYRAERGTITVTRNGVVAHVLYPEKRTYGSRDMPMTEAAIAYGLFGDLYVSLGEPAEGGAWSVRVYRKPFVNWIWIGCLLMAMGGVCALTDPRYRLRAANRQSAADMATTNA